MLRAFRLVNDLPLLAYAGLRAGGMADGLIAGVGFAVLSWIVLIAPSATAPGSLLVKVTSAAYWVLDLVVFLTGEIS